MAVVSVGSYQAAAGRPPVIPGAGAPPVGGPALPRDRAEFSPAATYQPPFAAPQAQAPVQARSLIPGWVSVVGFVGMWGIWGFPAALLGAVGVWAVNKLAKAVS
ncbi:MAG: hypothetical protein FJZ01_13895 [Candidatus Sericytochromatia bacterium]|nr:hypothetical protein [Candidatus Tanganyikabacteria bacterium]